MEPTLRPSARVILIGPGARTLLFRGGDPYRPDDGTWWFTPGGGVDPGEATDDAARRELYEETGQADVDWGGVVARREAVFGFAGAIYRSQEVFFVAHTSEVEVRPTGLTLIEEESVEEYRWLAAADVAALAQPVYPRELAGVLPGLAARRYPAEPWEWQQ